MSLYSPVPPLLDVAVPNPDQAWQQMLARDPAADGCFVYAVRSTGIFCRPTCSSRRPLRANVVLFATSAAAADAGYRPCLRCKPADGRALEDRHARTVHRVTEHLAGLDEAPTLLELTRSTGISATAMRRAFQHVLGLTPAQFLRAQRLRRFRAELHTPDPAPVTTALHAAGFSSPSRLYASSRATLGMTPSSLRGGAPAETIYYTVADSALGRALVATTERGICAIYFARTDAELLGELRSCFPRAALAEAASSRSAGTELTAQQRWLAQAVEFVLAQLSEHPLAAGFPTDVRATAFQQRVWQALQGIPRGETLTYAQLAACLGQPTAARAVARACAQNPLALLNPCHRVIGSSGALTGYRWGLGRKQQILAVEKS